MACTSLTSISNPLRIAEIAVGTAGGRIGITFAPGKQQPDGLTGAHRRDLGADLDAIAAWNAAVVITLVEPHELDSLGIAVLGAEVRRRHMEWHHWALSTCWTEVVMARDWGGVPVVRPRQRRR